MEALPDEAVAPRSRTVFDAAFVNFSIHETSASESRLPGNFLKVTLRNATYDRSLWIKHSVVVGSAASPLTAVQLDIQDEQGRQVLPNCRIRGGPPGTNHYAYVRLGPQSEISTFASLICFGLSSGRYRVTAHYEDRGPSGALPLGSWWFAGKLVSETIDVQIP